MQKKKFIIFALSCALSWKVSQYFWDYDEANKLYFHLNVKYFNGKLNYGEGEV